ncbi:hypothetical protein BDQ12DRAFT_1571 [Crucibulum laeve]|uniref:F-box domain-containing protein n=1 Tax=Crucibulum laeve TaxID=68775 RepID=A0A5C3MI60_9AGAR|nr:hypothetical protein BDQ12DRAFT_1571 [Crucibulum laeve]
MEDPHYSSLVNTSLSLSSNLPISLDITAYRLRGEEHPLLKTLIPHSKRWKEFIFSSDIESLSSGSFSNLRSRLTSLHSLKFRIFGSSREDVASWPGINIFEDCPQLRDVELELPPSTDVQVTDSFMFPSLPFPWSQLTCFTGKHMHLSYILELLRQATLLTECNLHETLPCPPDTPDYQVVVAHHSLQKLSISGISLKSYTAVARENRENFSAILFKLLVLPSLNNLSINLPEISIDAGILIDFISRSACSLTSLTVLVYNLGDNFILLLKSTPHLSRLDIKRPSSSALSMLVYSKVDPAPPLLPKLRQLDIHSPASNTVQEILQIVESRSQPYIQRDDTRHSAVLLETVSLLELSDDSLTSEILFTLRGREPQRQADEKYKTILKWENAILEFGCQATTNVNFSQIHLSFG